MHGVAWWCRVHPVVKTMAEGMTTGAFCPSEHAFLELKTMKSLSGHNFGSILASFMLLPDTQRRAFLAAMYIALAIP